MKIRTKEINRVKYYSFTDIMKVNGTNITQEISIIPKNNIIAQGGRGRSSVTYVDRDGIKIWFSNKRRIKCAKLNNFITQELGIDKRIVSSETLFLDILQGFLNEYGAFTLERQKNILNYNVDLCINNKLVVEFDEYGHSSNKRAIKHDEKRELEIKKLGYKIMRVKSCDPIGKSLYKVYGELKKHLAKQ